MEIAFDSVYLRSLCENEELAISEFGTVVAAKLMHRLADLLAALSINDILVGSPRVISNKEDHKFIVINITDNYQIELCANHQHNPIDEDGKVNWKKVNRIKILRIGRNLW